MFGQLLAVDCRCPRVVYDDCRIGCGERNSAGRCNDFCRRDFRGFFGCGNHKPRHLRQADHNGNGRLDRHNSKENLCIKGAGMAVWKNGRDMAFVYGENRLTPQQVQQAANSMTYCGLQTAAASFLLLCQNIGLTPRQTAEILESEAQK